MVVAGAAVRVRTGGRARASDVTCPTTRAAAADRSTVSTRGAEGARSVTAGRTGWFIHGPFTPSPSSSSRPRGWLRAHTTRFFSRLVLLLLSPCKCAILFVIGKWKIYYNIASYGCAAGVGQSDFDGHQSDWRDLR